MNSARKIYVPVVFAAAFGCSQDRVMDEVTQTTITTAGGTARSFDGLATVDFPDGALSRTTDITILTKTARGLDLITRVYEIGPASVLLNEPVALSIVVPNLGGQLTIVRIPGAEMRVPVDTTYENGLASASITTLGPHAVRVVTPVFDAGPSNATDGGSSTNDGGPDGGPWGVDGGSFDGGPWGVDGGPFDGGAWGVDGGPFDGGPWGVDGGPIDGGSFDGGPFDGGAWGVDGGPIDGGGPFDGGHGLGDGGPGLDGGGVDAGGPGASACGISPRAEQEPNDGLVAATFYTPAVDPYVPFTGDFSSAADIDWFAFDVQSINATLRVSTHTVMGDPLGCAGIDTVLSVTDSAGVVLGTNDDANGGTCSEVVLLNPVATTTFIQVRANAASTVPYFVTVYERSSSAPNGADLVVDHLAVANTTWRRSVVDDVVACVSNHGSQTMPSSTTGLFLSSNNVIRLTDTLMAQSVVPTLAPGAIFEQRFTFAIPAGVPAPSTQYFGAIGDLFSNGAELRETNNISSAVLVNVVP